MDITLTKITQFSGHKDAIYAIVYHSEEKYALSAGADGMIVRWEIHGNGDGKLIANVGNTVYAMQLDEAKNLLFLVTRSGEFICIDLNKKETIKRLLITTNPLFSLHNTTDAFYLGDEKGTMYQLDYNFELIHKSHIATKSLRQIIRHKDSLYVGTSDHDILHLDLSLKSLDQMKKAHDNSIFALSHSNKQLWSGGRDAHIKIWESNELTKSIKAHTLHVNSLDYNPIHQLMLSASMDKSVKIWDTKSHKLLKVLNKEKSTFHISSVNKVLWIGSNEFISCSDDRTVIYTEIDIK